MKKLLVFLTVLWGGGMAGYWYWNELQAQHVTFRAVVVKRGDLLATINATGTLEPEEVVDVGVQIAGEIQRFGADARDAQKSVSYGSPVEEGSILAQLDDRVLRARVNQSKASLSRAEADLEQARVKARQSDRDLERVKKLHSKHSISAQEYDTALFEQESAHAGLTQAESTLALAHANLEEATINLGYTTIRSPVKGVILDRRVNIGQTVVASLNAPSLFLIAKDLRQMEIWASVNETDVGAIRIGQGVRFTVGAFPDDSFRGEVGQIRLNASMTQNVVTYTVVVKVDNTSGKLLPYLTARLQFEVEDRKDALLVPNAALRYQPKVQHVAPEARATFERSLRRSIAAPKRKESRADIDPTVGVPGTLWVREGEFVRPVPVHVGLTDGLHTEILGGDIKEGDGVVIGLAQKQDEEEGASPFLPKLKNEKKKDK